MQIARWTSSRRGNIATRYRLLRLCVTAVLLVAAAGLTSARIASGDRSSVSVIPIDGVIDLGLAPYVERTLTEGAAQKAATVVFEINTTRRPSKCRRVNP